jgi:hypothetical protein
MECVAVDPKVLVVEAGKPFNRPRAVVIDLSEEELFNVRRLPAPELGCLEVGLLSIAALVCDPSDQVR